MPQILVEDRIQERMHARSRWELYPAPDNIGLGDLDAEAVHTCVRMAEQCGRLNDAQDTDLAAILRRFNLMNKDRLLNAAVICFGNEQCSGIYPQMLLRMARFRGLDRLADFDDNRQVHGNLFTLLTAGERFLHEHNPIAGRVEPDSWVRKDRPRYAPRAVREALANALVHRDYAMHGGSTALAIYNDRLEITNPGRFHFGMTPADLAQRHESRPWNPTIAGVFYRAGIIEQWGTGSTNIIAWCRENAAPPPTWDQFDITTVRITFHPAAAFAPQDPPQDPPQVTEAMAAVIRACQQPQSRVQLQEIIGVADRKDFKDRYLNPALATGVIELTIPDKPTSRHQRYRLTATGEVWLARNLDIKDKAPT